MHTIVLSRHRVEEEPRIVSWIHSLFPECRIVVAEQEGAGACTPMNHPGKKEDRVSEGPLKKPLTEN